MPEYARLDVRMGYRIGERWTLSVAGQNLLSPRHTEGYQELLNGYSQVNRGFYLKCMWRL